MVEATAQLFMDKEELDKLCKGEIAEAVYHKFGNYDPITVNIPISWIAGTFFRNDKWRKLEGVHVRRPN